MPAAGAYYAPLTTPRIVMPRGRVGMTSFATSLACRLPQLLGFHASQAILTRRVTWPLLSQYVCFLAIKGSSIAGWICPVVSIAREVTVCSPGEGFAQSRDQIFQACSASSL